MDEIEYIIRVLPESVTIINKTLMQIYLSCGNSLLKFGFRLF